MPDQYARKRALSDSRLELLSRSTISGSFPYDGDDWQVVDAGSRNGIKVNGDPTDRHMLRHGDVIQMGAFTLIFVHVADNEVKPGDV